MEIKYQPYEDQNYEDVKRITLDSFELTSFCTDPKIPRDKAHRFAWEIWCRPVLESDKKKYCIVALHAGKVVGYIIYGAHAEYTRVLHMKIGSIILMAVEEKYRGKHGIAGRLLEYVLDIFRKNKVVLVTVGTDLDNLGALINYVNHGFKPMLSWATLRYHQAPLPVTEDPEFRVEKMKQASFDLSCEISRPIPYLIDHRINRKERASLEKSIKQKIREEIDQGKLSLYQVLDNSSPLAFFTLTREEQISTLMEKGFYRINDIILNRLKEAPGIRVMKSILTALPSLYPDLSILEVFVRLNHWDLLNILTGSGFSHIHNAVNLHCHLL